jgi:hypothetical protein
MAEDKVPQKIQKITKPAAPPIGDEPGSVEKRGGQTTPAHAPLPSKGTQLPVPPPPPRTEPSKSDD